MSEYTIQINKIYKMAKNLSKVCGPSRSYSQAGEKFDDIQKHLNKTLKSS